MIGVSAYRRIRSAKTSQIHRDYAISSIREQIYLVFKDLMGQRPAVNEENGLFFLWIIVINGNFSAVI